MTTEEQAVIEAAWEVAFEFFHPDGDARGPACIALCRLLQELDPERFAETVREATTPNAESV
jgi:hypothetical protein